MNELKPEDVMKALECCIEDGYFQECFLKDFEGISVEDVLKAALALLREKDAEIERLQGMVSTYEEERKYHFAMSRKRIDEAITEFVEKVKGFFADGIYDFGDCYFEKWLDQIAEEMKEKNES